MLPLGSAIFGTHTKMSPTRQDNSNMFHLLAQVVASKLIDKVLKDLLLLLGERGETESILIRLRELWELNLKDKDLLRKNHEPQTKHRVEAIKRKFRYMEKVTPIGPVKGCSGKPDIYMERPKCNDGNKSNIFEYALKPV